MRYLMTCGTLEMEILNSMWILQQRDEDSDISVKEVVDNLKENNISRAYTTVKTVMDRLSTKDLLVRYKQGKKFFYRTVQERSEMAADSVDVLIKQFFNGDYVELLRFVETECSHFLINE